MVPALNKLSIETCMLSTILFVTYLLIIIVDLCVCLYVHIRDLYDFAISDNNLKLNYRFNLNFNLIYLLSHHSII